MEWYILRFIKGRVNRTFYFLGILFVAFLLAPPISITILLFPFLLESTIIFSILSFFGAIIVFLFPISLAVRRLHDFNCSGGWLFLFILPILTFQEIIIDIFGVIFVLFLLFKKGNEGENKYGKPLEKKTKFFNFKEWNFIEKANKTNITPTLLIVFFFLFIPFVYYTFIDENPLLDVKKDEINIEDVEWFFTRYVSSIDYKNDEWGFGNEDKDWLNTEKGKEWLNSGEGQSWLDSGDKIVVIDDDNFVILNREEFLYWLNVERKIGY